MRFTSEVSSKFVLYALNSIIAEDAVSASKEKGSQQKQPLQQMTRIHRDWFHCD